MVVLFANKRKISWFSSDFVLNKLLGEEHNLWRSSPNKHIKIKTYRF